jgi:hypothetical protein
MSATRGCPPDLRHVAAAIEAGDDLTVEQRRDAAADALARLYLAEERSAAADRAAAVARQELTEAIIATFNKCGGRANWRSAGPVAASAIVSPGDEWVSAREAAEIACRGIDCIHVWRKDGKIRAQKRAGRWEFELQSLRAHIRT